MKPISDADKSTIRSSSIDRQVLIIQTQLKQYRAPFFCQLHEALEADGIRLTVAYSDPVPEELGRSDTAELPENIGLKVRGYWLARGRVLYQPLILKILSSDLVILEQANKHILNWPLMIASRLGAKKIAFWGHGRNRQKPVGSLTERLKKIGFYCADWWFAYTDGVATYVSQSGFPSSKITTVHNSIDLREFRFFLTEVHEHHSVELRRSLNIPPHASVALYCGGLYPEKRIDFLVNAAQRVHHSVPEFNLIIIGGGPAAAGAKAAADQYSWVHYVGPQFRLKRAQFFRLANIFLMPAAVGLSILDSFAAGLPIITTSIDNHGPEIEYLQDGVNGLMVVPDTTCYADAIIHVLQTPELLTRLKEGALDSSQQYSMEAMVSKFRTGVVRALACTP